MVKSKMSDTLETTARRAKLTEIWALGVSMNVYRVHLTVMCFKFSLGSFGAFPIFDNFLSRKWLVVGGNGPKFGPHGVSTYCM